MAELKLTLHDAMLVNVAGVLVVTPMVERLQLEGDLAAARTILPYVSRDVVLLRDLAAAVGAMVLAAPERMSPDLERRAPWTRARFDTCLALEQILRWRLAQAMRQAGHGSAAA